MVGIDDFVKQLFPLYIILILHGQWTWPIFKKLFDMILNSKAETFRCECLSKHTQPSFIYL